MYITIRAVGGLWQVVRVNSDDSETPLCNAASYSISVAWAKQAAHARQLKVIV